jgi:hypothetical protein
MKAICTTNAQTTNRAHHQVRDGIVQIVVHLAQLKDLIDCHHYKKAHDVKSFKCELFLTEIHDGRSTTTCLF